MITPLEFGLGRLLRQASKESYTISIYEGARNLLNHWVAHQVLRAGTITITNPEGVEIFKSYWMDYPEKHWKITRAAYYALPIEVRAQMEAEEQLTYNLPEGYKDAYNLWGTCGPDGQDDKYDVNFLDMIADLRLTP